MLSCCKWGRPKAGLLREPKPDVEARQTRIIGGLKSAEQLRINEVGQVPGFAEFWTPDEESR